MKSFTSKILSVILLVFFSGLSNAQSEIFKINGELTGAIQKNSRVTGKLTVAGYPVPITGADWIFTNSSSSFTTGGSGPLVMVRAAFVRWQDSKLAEGFSVIATTSQGGAPGWEGDPCGTPHIERINIIRGRLDRCAVASVKTVPVSGIPTKALTVFFLETNQDGRYLKYENVLFFERLGIQENTLQLPEFRSRLKDWMSKMLQATIKAADYSKPADAFDGIPSFIEVAAGNISNSVPQSPTPNITNRSEAQNISTQRPPVNPGTQSATPASRLQTLEELYKKGLVSEDEYKQKRAEILKEI